MDYGLHQGFIPHGTHIRRPRPALFWKIIDFQDVFEPGSKQFFLERMFNRQVVLPRFAFIYSDDHNNLNSERSQDRNGALRIPSCVSRKLKHSRLLLSETNARQLHCSLRFEDWSVDLRNFSTTTYRRSLSSLLQSMFSNGTFRRSAGRERLFGYLWNMIGRTLGFIFCDAVAPL